MTTYDRETLKQLRAGELPFENVHEIQSAHKDPTRFTEMLAIAQATVAWDDRILLPYAEHLYIVEKPRRRPRSSSATAATSSATTREQLEALGA